MTCKVGGVPNGDLRADATARASLKDACKRLAMSCARGAQDAVLCIPALPGAMCATVMDAARETRRRPHMGVRHWNGVPFGIEALAWAMGSGTGMIAPGVSAALIAIEGIFYLALPNPPTRVCLVLGERCRSGAERAVSGYWPYGRQGISPSGHLEAGTCLAWLGRHEEALEAYARAGGAEPAGLLPCLRGLSLACLGRHGDACLEYAEALLMDPGLAVAQAALEVSRTLPDGCLGDPEGRSLFIILDTGGSNCPLCSRAAHWHGHVCLDGAGADPGGLRCASATVWRLCHMRSRWWNVCFGARRASLLATAIAILILLPFDHGLAMTFCALRMIWARYAD